jgi:hypothetical protein
MDGTVSLLIFGRLPKVDDCGYQLWSESADILAEDLSPTRNPQFDDFTLASEINEDRLPTHKRIPNDANRRSVLHCFCRLHR